MSRRELSENVRSDAGSASIAQVREALSEGPLNPSRKSDKGPEFAGAPETGGGALTRSDV